MLSRGGMQPSGGVHLAAVLTTLICLQLIVTRPRLAQASEVLERSWYVPTRVTTSIPCFDENIIKAKPGRTMNIQLFKTALYRWIQSNGNIIGTGFYQTVRLLKMPSNHEAPFHVVNLACSLYGWSADATQIVKHSVHFYEGPSVTTVVSLGFKSWVNFTNFVAFPRKDETITEWCRKEELCIQAMVTPVRNPEFEYPRLFDLARSFKRTPLTDLKKDMDRAMKQEESSESQSFAFNVNFILRLSPSRRLQDLCNPQDSNCAKQLLTGQRQMIMRFSEASVQMLDTFAQNRATLRKLSDPKRIFAELPTDVLNFTIQVNSLHICPHGYAPAGSEKEKVIMEGYFKNKSSVYCLPCPPGTYGSNGLNCFDVVNDFYTTDWAQLDMTPCPAEYVTFEVRGKNRTDCEYNGTLPERIVIKAMEHAWEEIETIYYETVPSYKSALLIVYLFVTAYSLFWQLHRLITLMRYQRRLDMSDRLLKRFIAEAYLRDLRRMQYWEAAIKAAEDAAKQQDEAEDTDTLIIGGNYAEKEDEEEVESERFELAPRDGGAIT